MEEKIDYYEQYLELKKKIKEEEDKQPLMVFLKFGFIGFCVSMPCFYLLPHQMPLAWKLSIIFGAPLLVGIIAGIIAKAQSKKSFLLSIYQKQLDSLLSKHGAHINEQLRLEEKINKLSREVVSAMGKNRSNRSILEENTNEPDWVAEQKTRIWYDSIGHDHGYIDERGIVRERYGKDIGLRVDKRDHVFNENNDAVGYIDDKGTFNRY